MPERVAIELQNVTKTFDKIVAINRLSLNVMKGEFFAVLGPSGAGKSTLVRMVGGSESPDEGEIYLDGHLITSLPPYKRNINTVFQNLLLFPHMTVFENVGYGLRMKNRPRLEVETEVLKTLDFMGLSRHLKRKPNRLSGGEQQRVAIARALINKPLVLICDEPLAALDPLLRKQLQEELKRINEELGITLLYITHNQEEALGLADRIALLNKGELVQVGTPQQVYSSPVTRFAAEFVGTMNIFEGVLLQGSSTVVTKEGYRISLPSGMSGMTSCKTLFIGVRPERVVISNGDQSQAGNTIKGIVKDQVFMGPGIRYTLELEQGKLISVADFRSDRIFHKGAVVKAHFKSDDIIILGE